MRATVTVPFNGKKDKEHYPTRFAKGDVIDGELAEVAVKEKWAEPVKEGATQK